jgi:hypothetical protein
MLHYDWMCLRNRFIQYGYASFWIRKSRPGSAWRWTASARSAIEATRIRLCSRQMAHRLYRFGLRVWGWWKLPTTFRFQFPNEITECKTVVWLAWQSGMRSCVDIKHCWR